MSETKRCSKCDERKLITEFQYYVPSWDKDGGHRIRNVCTKCLNEQRRARYNQKREATPNE